MITSKQFSQLFPDNKQPEVWTEAIITICPRYGIDPVRLAMFLAQCGTESMGFTKMLENLNYSAQALANTWPNRYAVDSKAKTKVPNELANRLARHPEDIGNNCYANRNGNGPEESGDGYKYRGHGPLQVTGKGNMQEFAHAAGKTLEEALEYILTPEGGILSACLYWESRNINPSADKRDVIACTKKVNGGLNGLAERQEIYTKAAALLGVV